MAGREIERQRVIIGNMKSEEEEEGKWGEGRGFARDYFPPVVWFANIIVLLYVCCVLCESV